MTHTHTHMPRPPRHDRTRHTTPHHTSAHNSVWVKSNYDLDLKTDRQGHTEGAAFVIIVGILLFRRDLNAQRNRRNADFKPRKISLIAHLINK